MKKIDINILNKYFEDGLLMKQVHPKYPLIIWNYSRKVQIENLWDDITTQMRGLITDTDGNIVARPFPKFFNLNQLPSVGLTVPNEEFDVYSKEDGSLIIIYWYDNQWNCASRGSFTSDYAIKATELLNNYPSFILLPNQTYCFELLWTKHVIVITPEKDDLIMLGSFVTETGEEMDIHRPYYLDNFNVVKKYDGITDYTKITEIIDGTNKEGFVIRFKSGFRCKIKYQEYLRLHRILTNISTTVIWESLRDGVDLNEFLENVPDEFDEWVRDKIKRYRTFYDIYWSYYVEVYNRLYEKFNGDFSDKKKVAEEIKTNYSEVQKPLFNMINEKGVDEYIWSLIKPEFEKPNF